MDVNNDLLDYLKSISNDVKKKQRIIGMFYIPESLKTQVEPMIDSVFDEDTKPQIIYYDNSVYKLSDSDKDAIFFIPQNYL